MTHGIRGLGRTLMGTAKNVVRRSKKFLAVAAVATTAALAMTPAPAKAESAIDTSEVSQAITDGKAQAKDLIIAGFGIYGIFVLAKIVKKGISRVG